VSRSLLHLKGLRRIDDAPRRAYRYHVTDPCRGATRAGDGHLTYRTDLRELNDLNFARFDAKLEQRLAELRSDLLVELRTGLQQVRSESHTELQQVRTELQQVRTELLRWMFGFWVTTLLSIGGLLVAILSSAP
jgi:hypothetical protein